MKALIFLSFFIFASCGKDHQSKPSKDTVSISPSLQVGRCEESTSCSGECNKAREVCRTNCHVASRSNPAVNPVCENNCFQNYDSCIYRNCEEICYSMNLASDEERINCIQSCQ